MSIEQYQNNAATTLNGAINNSTTSVVVTSGAVFPSTGDFRLMCEDEIMICTSRSGNTLTVTRGAEGTTAASHADTTAIRHGLTAASFLKLLSEGNSRGTYANLPAAGRAGRIYRATDNPFIYYDNGSSWDITLPGTAMDFNPNLSAFSTWLNQDSATISTTNGYQVLTGLTNQPNSTERWHGRYDAIAGGANANFTMTLVYQALRTPGAISIGGIILRNSGNSRFMAYDINIATGVPQLQATTWSSPTANNSSLFSDSCHHVHGGSLTFLRLVADGTNFKFYYSIDFGRSWLLHKNIAISGSYLATYDQIGFAFNNFSQNNSVQEHQMNVYHALAN